MILRPPGISRKTGKPYEAFYSCPNYKTHPQKTGYTPKPNPELILLDEMQAGFKEINNRLDGIEKGWLEKLEGIRTAFKELK